uniref:Uncharacterized protein n=1 Tax=Oryza sativa subsp. indica TaxID=39946 RepID=A6N0Y7_ORYSI|nr:unknown [Oryza sativa Indica Group]
MTKHGSSSFGGALSLCKVILMVLALICTLHTASVQGGSYAGERLRQLVGVGRVQYWIQPTRRRRPPAGLTPAAGDAADPTDALLEQARHDHDPHSISLLHTVLLHDRRPYRSRSHYQ